MEKISIYTDGACSGNPGPGGCAFVAVGSTGSSYARKYGYKHTTNNRMELRAVIWALKYAVECHDIVNEDIEVEILSDSQLVVNTVNLGWAKKSNVDLWELLEGELAGLKAEGVPVSFSKIAGHSGDKWNEEADRLAVEACSMQPKFNDQGYHPKESIVVCDPVKTPETPKIVHLFLKHDDEPAKRTVEVTLSNGTVVKITGYNGGFVQSCCTQEEAKLTLNIAWTFNDWLNGASL